MSSEWTDRRVHNLEVLVHAVFGTLSSRVPEAEWRELNEIMEAHWDAVNMSDRVKFNGAENVVDLALDPKGKHDPRMPAEGEVDAKSPWRTTDGGGVFTQFDKVMEAIDHLEELHQQRASVGTEPDFDPNPDEGVKFRFPRFSFVGMDLAHDHLASFDLEDLRGGREREFSVRETNQSGFYFGRDDAEYWAAPFPPELEELCFVGNRDSFRVVRGSKDVRVPGYLNDGRRWRYLPNINGKGLRCLAYAFDTSKVPVVTCAEALAQGLETFVLVDDST